LLLWHPRATRLLVAMLLLAVRKATKRKRRS